jgi:hypothetical protein
MLDFVKKQNESIEQSVVRLKLEKETLEIQHKMVAQAGEKLKAAFLANEQSLKEIEYNQAILRLKRKGIEAQLETKANLSDQEKEEVKEIERLEEILKLRLASAKAVEATEAQTKNVVKALTGIGTQWRDTFLGGFATAAEDVDGLSKRVTRLWGELENTITSANVAAAALTKMAQSTAALWIAQDQAIAQFNKATSSLYEYNDQIINIERANVGLGISTADAGSAFGALLTNVTTFSGLAPAVQQELANTTARMEKLGVGVQLTAKTMEDAMLVFDMSADQAQALTSTLADMAIKMKLPIEQVIEGFNAAMPVLAKFGKDAPDIFKKIGVASRSLGVSIGDLIGTMSQFDTFAGAATAAGKLNTILGGDLLNSTELLMADEAERLRMVRESIALSGRQFSDMNRFEKLAIANTLGIQDMATATKMLGNDMDRFGYALDASGLSDKDTAARISATMSITEKLAQTWRMFAISFRWPVEALHGLMSKLFEINEGAKGWLIPTLGLVAVAIAGLRLRQRYMQVKAFGQAFLKLAGDLSTAAGGAAGLVSSVDAATGALTRMNVAATGAGGAVTGTGTASQVAGASVAGMGTGLVDARGRLVNLGTSATGASSSLGTIPPAAAAAGAGAGAATPPLNAAAAAGTKLSLAMGAASLALMGFQLGTRLSEWADLDPLMNSLLGVAFGVAAVKVALSSGAAAIPIAAGLFAMAAAFGVASYNKGTSGSAGSSLTDPMAAPEGIGKIGTKGGAGPVPRQAGGDTEAGQSYVTGDGASPGQPPRGEIWSAGMNGRVMNNQDFRRIPKAEIVQVGSSSESMARPDLRDLQVNLNVDSRTLAKATVKGIGNLPEYNVRTGLA